MGINGLWQLVKTSGRRKTIPDLVQENGYSFEARESRMLKFGVDISIMFDECLVAENSSKLFNRRYGGALCIFFYKLCKFLTFPAVFIFVFDGPERPTTKRGRNINAKKDPWWTEACTNMINSMGFHVHQAPGEAEAELGHLSQLNMIDGVISTDSDALIYGARKILKRIPKSNGAYEVYTNTAIVKEVSYGPGDLLLLALFSGGDYSNGVPNCGSAIVTALVQCGFGAQLCQHLSELHGIELEDALTKLSKDIKYELQTNSKHFLTSRKPLIAEHITPDLFSSSIRRLYTDPVTSWSSPKHKVPNALAWTTREPDLLDVIKVSSTHFGWNTVDKLIKNLHNVLLEGLFIRALCSHDINISKRSREISTNSQDLEVLQFTVKGRRNEPKENPPWGQLQILAITARDTITTVGGKDRNTSSEVTKLFTKKVWVPLSYLPPNLFSILPHPDNALRWIGNGARTQNFNGRETDREKGKKRDHFTAFADPSTSPESSSMAHDSSANANTVIDLTLDNAPFTVFPDSSTRAESSLMARCRHSSALNANQVIDFTLDSDPERATAPSCSGIIDLTADEHSWTYPPSFAVQPVIGEVFDISDSD